MASNSIEPQVLATSGLYVCDDMRTTTGSWIPTGVVTADLRVSFQGTGVPFFQGTGVPFAGRNSAAVAPRQHKGTSTGIRTSSPPV